MVGKRALYARPKCRNESHVAAIDQQAAELLFHHLVAFADARFQFSTGQHLDVAAAVLNHAVDLQFAGSFGHAFTAHPQHVREHAHRDPARARRQVARARAQLTGSQGQADFAGRRPHPPEQYTAFVQSESAKWAQVIQAAGIKGE